MKPLHVLSLALTAALAAGCEKSSDLAPLASETRDYAASSKQRIEDLDRRAQQLARRGVALNASGPDVVPVSSLLGSSQRTIAELKAAVDQAPASVDAALKSGKYEEVSRVALRLRKQVYNGELEVTSNLEQVDAWVSRKELHPGEVSRPAPVDAPETGPADPAAPATADR